MFSFIVDKRINSALKNNHRTHTFLKFTNIKKVLVLFSSQDWVEINDIVKNLESLGKSVILWAIHINNNDTTIHLPPKVRTVEKRDISFVSGLSSSVINEFRDLIYDTLLDLTTKEDKSIPSLLANTTAEFSIGIQEREERFYDFILLKEEDKNLFETYEQIKFYLNNIR